MAPRVIVQSDASNVTVSLRQFELTLQRKEELLRIIGVGQLVSVRRTFRESGSPAGSWAPYAASTLKRYGSGHKLLINTGRLLNSITFAIQGTAVVIGTALNYAAVHQFGSRDRGNVFGPRTKAMEDALASVSAHDRQYSAGMSRGKYGRVEIIDKNGKRRMVRMKRQGPIERRAAHVGAHQRHQNIPARPFLVFRPEDPRRIQEEVQTYVRNSAKAAGLETV